MVAPHAHAVVAEVSTSATLQVPARIMRREGHAGKWCMTWGEHADSVIRGDMTIERGPRTVPLFLKTYTHMH